MKITTEVLAEKIDSNAKLDKSRHEDILSQLEEIKVNIKAINGTVRSNSRFIAGQKMINKIGGGVLTIIMTTIAAILIKIF